MMIAFSNMSKSKQLNPLLGVIGGMGTYAGLYFEKLLFNVCRAKGCVDDQSYPEWIYFNASKIPDRTKAIRNQSPLCETRLVQTIEKAKLSGVSGVVVTCNTAHHFYESVYQQVRIPWIHLQNEASRYIAKNYDCKKVGLLATDGTLISGLYQRAFESQNIEVVAPDVESPLQKNVMDAIYDPLYGIKNTNNVVSNRAHDLLLNAAEQLDISMVIAGCTEISVAFSQKSPSKQWVDPLRIAAECFYDLATGEREVSDLM